MEGVCFMKKILFSLLCFFLILGVANAAVNSETLQDACETESLDCVSSKEYDESLPNIYLFRGDGCPYCNELIKGAEFDFTPSGYPYLVVGEKTFDGYASSDDEDIKNAILELQNSEEAYDVVKELENKPVDSDSNDKAVIVIIACAVIVMGFYLANKIKNK